MKLNKQATSFVVKILPFGLIASLVTAYYGYASVPLQARDQVPILLIIGSSLVQILLLYTVVLAYVGFILGEKSDLKPTLALSKPALGQALLIACIGALLLLLDPYIFGPFIPGLSSLYTKSTYTLAYLLFSVSYGGFVEELLLRLFFLSLVAWIFTRIFKNTERASLHLWANIIAALVFALGHLPATKATFGSLTAALIIRSLILNGVLGYLFGYLYIKEGFTAAMIAHGSVHIISQLILHLFIL